MKYRHNWSPVGDKVMQSTPVATLCCIYGKKKALKCFMPDNIIRRPGGRERMTAIYKSFMRHGLPITEDQFHAMAFREDKPDLIPSMAGDYI